jgi:hypothetical protein
VQVGGESFPKPHPPSPPSSQDTSPDFTKSYKSVRFITLFTVFHGFSRFFLNEPCWNSITAFYRGGSLLGSTCTTSVAVAGQNLPRFWGCTNLFPHTAGFEILDVRLPDRGKPHLVVGAPRSHLTTRASTLTFTVISISADSESGFPYFSQGMFRFKV